MQPRITKDKYNATETVTKESIHAVSKTTSNTCNKKDAWQSKDKLIKSCKYCGKGHNTGQCPAKYVKCYKWSKVGHFANVCRSSNNNLHQGQQGHTVAEESDYNNQGPVRY